MKATQSYVLARYPQLSGVGQDVVINGWKDVTAFLDLQDLYHHYGVLCRTHYGF